MSPHTRGNRPRSHVPIGRIGGLMAVLMITVQPVAGQTRDAPAQAHPILPTTAGILFGAAGFLWGGLVGISLACGSGCDETLEGLPGFVFGATIGEALLLPLGVHVGNGSRGNLAADLGVSVTLAAASLGSAAAFNSEGLVFMGIIGQIVLTVMTERSTDGRLTVGIRPSGAYALGVNLAF